MRVFVNLDSYDVEFIKTLQRTVRHKTGYRPVIGMVLRAVLRDYKQVLERRSDPDFMESYRAAGLRGRGPGGKNV